VILVRDDPPNLREPVFFRWVPAADTCKQVQMGWRKGNESRASNQKRGGRRGYRRRRVGEGEEGEESARADRFRLGEQRETEGGW
jgi:hypothetical protein